MSDTYNPYVVKLEEVFITKFNGTDRLNIMPQVVEFVLHQSIFSSVLKATLVLSDSIGLMNNYPLTGEETIEVDVTQLSDVKKKLTFIIMAINNIVASDTSRTTTYIMELASEEAFANAKIRVSKAYGPTPAQDIIKDIYDNYIKASMIRTNFNYNVKELFLDLRTRNITENDPFVIPNIKPFDAINWLCQYAVAEENNIAYTPIFFETIDRFVFKGLQKVSYKSSTANLTALKDLEDEKYFYISNIELIKNNEQAYNNLIAKGFDETRSISDLVINKRYSGLEKIIGGYFENELVEINPFQRNRDITYTSLDADGKYYIETNGQGSTTSPSGIFNFAAPNRGSVYHTSNYMENIKLEDTRQESSARIHYYVNFFEGTKMRDKFGNSSRSFVAYQQVDLSIAVPSNLAHVPGDYIYVVLPEFHGFNENNEDAYLSGVFLISEVKTIMRQGGKSVTYLRINRDTFNQSVDRPSEYKL
jgi:hypothetical protein